MKKTRFRVKGKWKNYKIVKRPKIRFWRLAYLRARFK